MSIKGKTEGRAYISVVDLCDEIGEIGAVAQDPELAIGKTRAIAVGEPLGELEVKDDDVVRVTETKRVDERIDEGIETHGIDLEDALVAAARWARKGLHGIDKGLLNAGAERDDGILERVLDGRQAGLRAGQL